MESNPDCTSTSQPDSHVVEGYILILAWFVVEESEPQDNRPNVEALPEWDLPAHDVVVVEEEEFLDAKDFNDFRVAHINKNVDFTELAGNYFARVDEIHRTNAEEEDVVLGFDDLSSKEEEPDATPVLEEVLR